MDQLNYTEPTAVATQAYESLYKALGERDFVSLEDGITVLRTVGRVGCIVVDGPFGRVDLSQDPTGKLVAGNIQPTKYLGHDDERESTLGDPRLFPADERDSLIITGIVNALNK